MGIGETLKDNYFKAEDSWYKFIDSVSEKVPVVSSVIDKIEEKGIPTFPVAILLVVILILLILFSLIGTANNLTISVVDDFGEAVVGAQVTVFLDGTQVQFGETNREGKVSFYVEDQTYSVKIDKQGFSSVTRSEVRIGSEEFILSSQVSQTTKSIALRNASGQLISGSGTVIYSCVGSNEQRYATYQNGRFTVDFTDCSEVQIDSVSGYTIVEGRASFANADDIIVNQVEQSTGTVTINLSTSDDTPLSGLRVMLYNKNDLLTKTTYSSSDVVVFDDVITDSYYVTVSDPNGKFSDYSGSTVGEVKELRSNETISFNVSLQKSTTASITIIVRDATTSIPISGAEVKRKSVDNQNDLDTIVTGNSGQVTFFVAEGSDYLITAEHPNYLIPEPKRLAPGQEFTFNLVEATESNSQSLLVRVKDPRGDSISSTRVVLKKTDDTRIDEKITGANGKVQFFNLEFGNYFVFATKPGFASATTPSVQVFPRAANVIDVVLDIGTGIVEIDVSDQTGALPGASVKAVNINGEVEDEKMTDSQGRADFSIRVDKEVFFIVEAPGKASYYTSSLRPDERVPTQRDVFLRDTTGGLNVTLLGIQSESGEELEEDSEVINSGTYIAKLLLEVPSGNFTEAGVHVRTGNAQNEVTNVMEEDSIAIGKINSSTTRITKATTYTPPNGYNIDSQNLTNQNAKWANIVWNRPENAVYEVDAEILVTDSTISRAENFWYRAWTKGSSNLRDPPLQFTGHELYAPAKNRLFSLNNAVGSTLCTTTFCRIYSVKTLTGSNAGRTQGVSNVINTQQSNTYTLTAELTNLRAINSAVLDIDARGILVEEIKVNGTIQDDIINLGNLGVDSYNKVEITFTTNTPGNGSINLAINSATRNEFEQTLTINVAANKKFSLDILPRQLVPYITNTMIFEVIDNNMPLPRTIIEISKNNQILGIVETSGEGLASFELTSPTPGDEIKIVAKKEGYDKIEALKKVDDRLLLLTPPEISETIKIGEIRSINQTLLFTNQTVADATISRISTTGELERYLDIDFEGITGGTIASGEDSNYTITIRPNSLAQRLMEPLTVTGEIRFETRIEEANQSFVNSLPVRIRLSMPGYIDSDRCLKVTPTTIEFNASTSEVTQNIEIENNCVAEGIKVNLNELEAKLNENSNLGRIMVSGTGFTNATLNETFTPIAQILERDARQTLTVRFAPNTNISSGEQKIRVDLRAKNIIDSDTSETIDASFDIDISMSNLSKCLEVIAPSEGLVLEVAGWNMGYDRLMMSNISSHINHYQGFTGQGWGMGTVPYGLSQALPFTGQHTSEYEQGRFTIRNSCAVDVEVSLDADSRLSVSEERMTISRNSDVSVNVNPGYTLGRYSVGVNARLAGTSDTMRKIDDVRVTVRKLGESDPNCIKVNVTTLNFNSLLYKAERHKAFNYCYDTGIALDRANNAVTVQCEAPDALTTGVPYFQSGAQYQPLYSQHYPITGQASPIGGTFSSYHDYLRPAAGTESRNSCPMVAGTRVYDRRLIESATGSVEELTFEVLPSAQYIPQRKLFNPQQQSFGFFNSIIDIRQWATETDARTNIYGNLAVRYTNQYGSMQVMHFPIKIEDIWRIGESIDSAVNWGDPNARPEQCVDEERRENSLNIKRYWENKQSKAGAIPHGQYNRNNRYTHIAEPPAVRIGPASQTSLMANPYGMRSDLQFNQQLQMQQQQIQQQASGDSAANCGLLDRLSNFVYENEIGGVRISIDDVSSGSILNNTRGPNVAVTIDRSGIQHNCVYIDTVVTADLRRAINLQKGEVSWNLKAVVTRPGYEMVSDNPSVECHSIATGDVDCLAETRRMIAQYPNESSAQIAERVNAAFPVCQRSINENIVAQIKESADTTGEYTGECEYDPAEFGFDNIDRISLSQIENNLDKYCETSYCSTEMFTGYIYDKYSKIKNGIEAIGGFKPYTSGMLSELYKEADIGQIGNNNYYLRPNGQPISRTYSIPENFFSGDEKKEITDLTSSDNLAISNMIRVLGQIDNHSEEIFLEVRAAPEILNNLGYKVGNNLYVPLETYIEINQKVLNEISRGNKRPASISVAGINGTTFNMQELHMRALTDAQLVELINADTVNNDTEKINRIYAANPRLDAVRNIANKESVYVANISSLALPEQFISAELQEVRRFSERKEGFSGAGQYTLEIDLNYKEISRDNLETILKFSNKHGAQRASENILLQKDFKLERARGITNLLADQGGIYNNIPVKITATINSQQEILEYEFDNFSTQEQIINWTYNREALNETSVGNRKIVRTPVSTTAKTLTGTYLHPLGQVLTFNQVRVGTASIVANAQLISSERVSQTATTASVANIQFTTTPQINTERIIELVKSDNACVAPGRILWNMSKIS